MEYLFSEQQEMLRTMARDFGEKEVPKTLVRQMEKEASGFEPNLWKKMADLGWMQLPFPEQYGGMGSSFMDTVVLLEEIGRACLPSPYFTSVILSGMTILNSGDEAKKNQFLPGIGEGSTVFTLALTEPSASYEETGIHLKAEKTEAGHVLNGTKLFVPYADVSQYLIVAAREDKGISLFIVKADSPGITINPLTTITADKLYEVIFKDVKVPPDTVLGKPGKGWEVIEKTMVVARLALSAFIVGMTQKALEMAVDYAKTRIQFEKPIGTFQVLQHYCANMATDVETSKYATYKAAWALDGGLPAREETIIAKGWSSAASRRVIALAHQIHGATGFTADHDLGLYYKRLKGAELMFGDDEVQKELMARGMGL